MTRKEFLKSLGIGASALLAAGRWGELCWGGFGDDKSVKGTIFKGDAPDKPWKWSMEALHYEKTGDDVQCQVCPNYCYLEPGDRSICRSKVNIKGRLYSLTYGNPCAVNIDPIEKKPLNHFYPGTSVLSIAPTGCNLRCLNCQNWEISQKRPEDVNFTEFFPIDVIKTANKKESLSIAYTYSEAVTYYEYMFHTSKLAGESGIKNVLVSNGYINDEPLTELCKYMDGANINLKSFDNELYKKLNGGTLDPILNTFKVLHHEGVWFEMTTLVVPTYIDDPEMIKRMCGWILKELGPNYPLHFSRFFPNYKLDRLPATPVSLLEEFRNIAIREGIRYVYLGNVPGHEASNTYCHNCKKLLIERKGYYLNKFNINSGKCSFCKVDIPGRWMI